MLHVTNFALQACNSVAHCMCLLLLLLLLLQESTLLAAAGGAAVLPAADALTLVGAAPRRMLKVFITLWSSSDELHSPYLTLQRALPMREKCWSSSHQIMLRLTSLKSFAPNAADHLCSVMHHASLVLFLP
jgi:hypothetical protein